MTEQERGGLTVAIVGATGAVGQDLITALERSAVGIGAWRFFASLGCRETHLEAGGRSWPVETLDPDTLEEDLEDVDLVVFAAVPKVTRALAPVVAELGPAVIAIGGELMDLGPIAAPFAGRMDTEAFRERRLVVSPSAAAVAITTAVAPLVPAGLQGCRGVVMRSAGEAGRDATAELSGQVVALFNQSDPPREHFPQGLAFDLNFDQGDPVAGWGASERRLGAEVSAVLGLPRLNPALSLVRVPLFTGVVASLHLRFARPLSAEVATKLLEQSPLVRVTPLPPGPRALVGASAVTVSSVRDDPGGDGLHLWLVADNLRLGASANVIATLSRLIRGDLL